MLLRELKTGDVFAIEGSNSYPKLKLSNGYVDIRDEIVNNTGNCDNREVDVIDIGKIAIAMIKDAKQNFPFFYIARMIQDAKAKFIA